MEIQRKSQDGKTTVKFEVKSETEAVEKLFDFYNLFEKNNECGLCHFDTFFNVRQVDGNTYYEKKCSNCGASLPFHQYKKKPGCLYTKWSDEWKKWQTKPQDPDDGEEETPKASAKKASK